MTDASISAKAARSVKWCALAEAVSRAAQPLTVLILARLLTPSDYGLVTTAGLLIGFVQVFWDAGLGKALVQTRASAEEAADVVFWTNLALGMLVYGALFLIAPLAAAFFHSPESRIVLRVLGLQIIVSALTAVQQSLFLRDLEFRSIFWARLVTACVPALVAIPMAWLGCGVWALVASSLIGQLASSAVLWARSAWRPRWRYNTGLARGLLRFGGWVALEGLCGWFLMWGDNAIVGRYLGVHDLGIYRTGVVFVSLTFGLVLNPLLPILYPAFSRLQGDPCAVRDAFHKVNGLVCAIALPVGVGLLLTGSDLSRALFGAKWEGLGLVIGLLGLKDAVVWTVTVNGELYRAIGRPDLNTRLLVLFCCVFLPAYVLLAPLGIRAFTWGRACLALLTVPIHILVAVRLLRLSPFYLWRQARPSILATVLMAAAVYGAGLVLGSVFPRLPAAPRLGVLIATGVLTYGAAVWGLAPRMVSDAWRRFAREGASA